MAPVSPQLTGILKFFFTPSKMSEVVFSIKLCDCYKVTLFFFFTTPK